MVSMINKVNIRKVGRLESFVGTRYSCVTPGGKLPYFFKTVNSISCTHLLFYAMDILQNPRVIVNNFDRNFCLQTYTFVFKMIKAAFGLCSQNDHCCQNPNLTTTQP